MAAQRNRLCILMLLCELVYKYVMMMLILKLKLFIQAISTFTEDFDAKCNGNEFPEVEIQLQSLSLCSTSNFHHVSSAGSLYTKAQL